MTDYSSCNHYHFQFILVDPASHGGFERPQNYPEFTGGQLRKLHNTMDCYWDMFCSILHNLDQRICHFVGENFLS